MHNLRVTSECISLLRDDIKNLRGDITSLGNRLTSLECFRSRLYGAAIGAGIVSGTAATGVIEFIGRLIRHVA